MKKLLLIGAGHAHLHVLAALASEQIPDVQPTLVSSHPTQVYSGMLPGWMAGHYRLDSFAVPLAPLAAAAKTIFVPDTVERIDLVGRTAHTAGGETIPFDIASIDTGPTSDRDALPGLREHAISMRPLQGFIEAWQALPDRLAETARARGGDATLAVLGGGAGGVEIAFAAAFRARALKLPLKVTLVTGRDGLLPTFDESARERVARRLRADAIDIVATDAVAVRPDAVELSGGTVLPSDAVIAALGASAAKWPRESGLAVDPDGYITVDDMLRSTSHPYVFAAGDCASIVSHPRPKSGVYAVRAGPPLAANLKRVLCGEPLRPWRPQRRALYLISAGPNYAIGAYGGVSFEGEAIWRWKDRIDRRFVERYLTRYQR